MHLSLGEFAHNYQPNASTGLAPFLVTDGYMPRVPATLTQTKTPESDTPAVNTFLQLTREDLAEANNGEDGHEYLGPTYCYIGLGRWDHHAARTV